MKRDWESKALSDVCTIKPPKSEVRNRLAESDMVSFIPMEDLQIDSKTFPHSAKRPLSDVIKSYTYFGEGDVLLAKITPCFENGKLGIAKNLVNGVGFGSSEFIVFRPSKELSNEWLYYFLAQSTFRVEGTARMTGAVGHKRVAKEFIENYQIPVPTIDEQKRIVGILDESFKAIDIAKANTKKNLQNARAIFESYLNKIISSIETKYLKEKIGNVCKTTSGGTPLKSNKSYYDNGNIPWLVSGEVSKGEITFSEKFITEEGLKNSSAKLIPSNTVLVAMYGATAGQVGILRFKSSTNQAICAILPNNKFIPEFLYFFLLSKKAELIRQATGNAQPNISQIKIKNTKIPMVSISEQEHIVSKLNFLKEYSENLASIYQKKLTALEELKKSLLHQAFNGEL